MQEEIITKKREIINIFLKKGILVNPEFLTGVSDYDQISKIFDMLKTKNPEELEAAGKNPASITSEAKQTHTPTHPNLLENIKIINSHKEAPKKREPQDFIDYFNNR